MRKIIVTTLLLIFLLEAKAQNCSEAWENAKRAYYSGQIREVPKLLEGCLSIVTKDKLPEAYKLLINAYIVNGETDLAERYMQELLELQPLYKVQESDLQEFKILRNKYLAVSQYALGFIAGPLRPDYNIMRHHSRSGNVAEPSDYNEHLGISLGLTGDIRVVSRLYANLSILYDWRSFDQEEIILGFQRIYSNETQQRLTMPILLRYIQPIKSWNIFVGGGFGFHYMTKATGDFLHIALEGDFPIIDGTPFFEEKIDIINQHRRMTYSWRGSVGIQKPIDKYTIELKFSYERGLSNLIDENKRYFNKNLTENFAYVPDDVRVHAFLISVGFYRNFYKPQKKRVNK